MACWLPATRQRSVQLLGERRDDALGAADVAEAIGLLVLLWLANEFGAVALQAGKDVFDGLNREHDATWPKYTDAGHPRPRSVSLKRRRWLTWRR